MLNRVDSYAPLRNKLREMAAERNDFSGCPMPIEGQKLVIEPTYRYKGLEDIGREDELAADAEPATIKVRNSFYSIVKHCRVAICEDERGMAFLALFKGSYHSGAAILNTLGASDAWGIEQEHKALDLLGTMLRHRQFKQYLLTGSFLETSPRSGITYLFRKLRPTIAISSRSGELKILCTMCMHIIGFYEESFAGCLCPTDDVVSHLALCRGDEQMFWRRCNQHPPHEPESGL